MARFFATSRASVESSAAPPSSSSTSSSSSSNSSSGGSTSSSNPKDGCRATASSKTGSNATSTTTSGSRWSRRPRLRRQHAHDFESVPEKAIAVPAPALSRESLGSGYTEAPSSRGASETLSACSPSEAGLEEFLGDASDDDLSWLEADLSPSCALPSEPELEAEVGDSVALSGDDDDDEAGGVLEEEEEEEQVELCQQRHSGPLELRVEDFECGECIGKGSYSRVFLGTHVVSGTEWALKVVSKRKTFETRENLAHLREEKNISTKVQGSDFLVRTAGTFQNPRSVVFAMEYLPGGDLYERLSDKGTLPLGEAVAWVAQAVLAIEDLHALNIVHRDIKPENFLMGKSGTLKLTDFGFARQLAPEERLFSQFGTPEYVAPEVLNGCGHGMPVDLWALGVLIYELLVGHTPFKARSVDEMYERIAAGEYAFPSPPSRRSSPSSSSSKSLQRDNSRGKRVSMGKEGSRSRGSSNGGGCADGGAPGVYKSTGYRDRAGKGKVRGGGGTSGGGGSGVDAAQDPSAQALVKSLLCQAPRRRPSIADIKRHPFFSGVNFDALRAAVRAQADAEEEEAVVAAAMNGGEVWMREQPVICVSEDVDDNYGGVFAAF